MTRKHLFLAVCALAVFGMVGAAHAEHAWANYHWARDTSSFDLPVIDSMTAEWDYAFTESLSRWSQSNSLNNVVVATEEGSQVRKRCKMVAGHMRVCNASYGQNGWLGLASINLDSNGHISQGTAKMNDSYDWYFAAHPGEDNHVTCQEIGHVYGLGHTSEDGSSQNTCMDYSVDNPGSQWPNNHDYQMLSDIYGHLDSYNSYATGDGGGDTGTCNSPPGKGCNKNNGAVAGVPADAIMLSFDGGHFGRLGHALFVKPDGAGGLFVYHATLVPDVEHDEHDH